MRNRIPDRDLTWTPDPSTQAKHRRHLKSLPDDDPIIKVYRYVQQFYADYQRPPTFTEIAVGVKQEVKSNNSVQMALKRLVLASWVERIFVEKKRGDGSKYKPVLPYSDLYKKVVAFVQTFYVEHGVPPQVAQIAIGIGHKTSDGRAREIVAHLVKESYLEKVVINRKYYYKPPNYGVVNLEEYYTVLNWAASAKKKASG